MPYNPAIHHRRSIRLKEYDYTQSGAYFITIVTYEREPLFGEIVNGEMKLNSLGEIARREWFKTAELRPYIELYEDEFVVMPNHAHGIVWVGATRRVARTDEEQRVARTDEERRVARTDEEQRVARTDKEQRVARTDERPRGPVSGSIGAIIGGYKSAVTYAINGARQTRGAVVWHRNYYEHIIRNDADLNRIREYIANNPLKWAEDDLRHG